MARHGKSHSPLHRTGRTASSSIEEDDDYEQRPPIRGSDLSEFIIEQLIRGSDLMSSL